MYRDELQEIEDAKNIIPIPFTENIAHPASPIYMGNCQVEKDFFHPIPHSSAIPLDVTQESEGCVLKLLYNLCTHHLLVSQPSFSPSELKEVLV